MSCPETVFTLLNDRGLTPSTDGGEYASGHLLYGLVEKEEYWTFSNTPDSESQSLLTNLDG